MRRGSHCCGANRLGVCLFSGRPNSYDERTHSIRRAMSPTTLDRLPDTVVLQPGEALRAALDPATWLEMQEGRALLVSPPAWFGEPVFPAKTMLNEGDVHRRERGGGSKLSGRAPVRLRVHAQPQQAPAARPAEPRPVMRLVRLLTGS